MQASPQTSTTVNHWSSPLWPEIASLMGLSQDPTFLHEGIAVVDGCPVRLWERVEAGQLVIWAYADLGSLDLAPTSMLTSLLTLNARWPGDGAGYYSLASDGDALGFTGRLVVGELIGAEGIVAWVQALVFSANAPLVLHGHSAPLESPKAPARSADLDEVADDLARDHGSQTRHQLDHGRFRVELLAAPDVPGALDVRCSMSGVSCIGKSEMARFLLRANLPGGARDALVFCCLPQLDEPAVTFLARRVHDEGPEWLAAGILTAEEFLADCEQSLPPEHALRSTASG